MKVTRPNLLTPITYFSDSYIYKSTGGRATGSQYLAMFSTPSTQTKMRVSVGSVEVYYCSVGWRSGIVKAGNVYVKQLGESCMYTIESLLDKYQDKIIMVNKKKEPLAILKDLADIVEVDLNILHPFQLNIIKENIQYSLGETKKEVKLHFYKVIDNKKSNIYYNEINKKESLDHKPYFEERTVFVIHEETLGIQETNSELLYRDFLMLSGVTKKDLEEKNQYLFSYLSYISAWNE
ncbi:hypothetical protein SAMN04488569_10752 [Marinilactibacillus piezotolerans]|uniref:Uncharacterized protein n=1 Tax=Marinilactibacillus piezotolerans TaxID=258723 RepID=A0A1I4BLW7_9LACT|nr:hypothetical protein [Marinilactibacillus piezotolerans]SFK68979.1 hypothetical protein SAMN04488569_10752 [Marinilactibacillus piezotolerans]